MMKIEHVALSIYAAEDIHRFYQDTLGMEIVKEFVLNKELANTIFGIDKNTTVFLLRNEQVFLEIFITDNLQSRNCNHLCLSFYNRRSVFEKAQQGGYDGINVQKEHAELFFIKDGSGNIFELKE